MPDSLPSSTERTVVVHRHGALTYISLGFNALILLLILIGLVSHHERSPKDRGGDDRKEAFDQDGRSGHRGFGEVRREWKHRDFADRDGEGGGDRPWGRHGFAERGEAWSGGPGEAGARDFGAGRDHDRGWGGAGDRGNQPSSAEAMTDRFMLALTSKLALTDPESAQIRPIVQQGIVQFQKEMETQKDAHQKMIEDAKTKIRTVLTPDQQKQFDAMAAGFGGPPAPGK